MNEAPNAQYRMADSDWTHLANYDYGYEVDFAEATLSQAGIPVLVKGREVGIWGPGFAGATSQGLSIWVPKAQIDEARALLEQPDSG